jgi:hypothetical protein
MVKEFIKMFNYDVQRLNKISVILNKQNPIKGNDLGIKRYIFTAESTI